MEPTSNLDEERYIDQYQVNQALGLLKEEEEED